MLLAHLSHGLAPGALPVLGLSGTGILVVVAIILIVGGWLYNTFKEAMDKAARQADEQRRKAQSAMDQVRSGAGNRTPSSRREALEQRLQRMREKGESADVKPVSASTASNPSSGQPNNLSMDEMRARMRARQEYERRRAELRKQREAATGQASAQPAPVAQAPTAPAPAPVRETRRTEEREVVTLTPAEEPSESRPRPKPQPQREPQQRRSPTPTAVAAASTPSPAGQTLRLPALSSPTNLRDAFILREVLDKPLALRDR